MPIISSPNDFHAIARRRLPRFLFDYLEGAAGGERTAANNIADLGRVDLAQRVLRGAPDPQLGARLFGQDFALPLILAPVGMAGMYRRRGETQAVRAAMAKGAGFCLSTVSLCALEEVVAAGGQAPWVQLYMIRDRGFMRDFLDRATAAGCSTLLFTVDMAVPGLRYRDAHSGLNGRRAKLRQVAQAITHPRWAWDVGLRGRPHRLGNLASVPGTERMDDYIGWLGANFDPGISWRDLDWVRERWSGDLVLKGILDVDDARSAADLGASGIVVSNHGGRQQEGASSTVRALPRIAEAVGDRLTILADGGVRGGIDVARMLGLGAKGVLIGRAWVYALAAAGEAGVAQLIDLIARELRVTMLLAGVSRLEELPGTVRAPADW
jgi:L-lactate dehydrogenase (cytochrome)